MLGDKGAFCLVMLRAAVRKSLLGKLPLWDWMPCMTQKGPQFLTLPAAGQARLPQTKCFLLNSFWPSGPAPTEPVSVPRVGQGILGTEAQLSISSSAPLAEPLKAASTAWDAKTQRLVVGLIYLFFFNRKMSQPPLTLPWAGLGNHFQMRNNFREEVQLKLQAPSRIRLLWSWNLPEVGRWGVCVREGSQDGLLRLDMV